MAIIEDKIYVNDMETPIEVKKLEVSPNRIDDYLKNNLKIPSIYFNHPYQKKETITSTKERQNNSKYNDYSNISKKNVEEVKWTDITNELSDLKSTLRDCRDNSQNLYKNYLNTVNDAWLGRDKELFDTIFEANYDNQKNLFEKMQNIITTLEEANNKNNTTYDKRQDKVENLFNKKLG